ncbi:MAG: tagaturonate reductase [Oscillospiraceae bacterium]|nr:tagaturonate reductase [Oscillospiraceae bacterium]
MIKILQYGQGNFLRSFADLYFETLNQEQDAYEVHVVTSISRDLTQFTAQNNRYHVVLRGVDAGQVVEQPYPVNALKQVIDPLRDPQPYYALARDPELKIIVSNTTEAGICFRSEDKMGDFQGMTYPAKLTLFLYERFKSGLDGVYLLPVELIDNNADALYACVDQYIRLWKLPEAFRRWNETQNFYCNTLVDRIVSGYPKDQQTLQHMWELLGEQDKLMSVGEPFGLWVIECKGALEQYIKEGRHNIDVVLTDDVKPYKKRKVRLLNGSHTNLVPAGLMLGAETVYDCMQDAKLSAFVKNTLDAEIIPFVPGSEQFAADVQERFRNPYLNHQLTSIALNSISKWRARVLPSFRDNYEKNGVIPKWLTIGFSYLMALYARVEKSGDGYLAKLPTRTIQVLDEKPYLEHFANGGSIEAFMADPQIWGEDLTAYAGLLTAVLENVNKINAGECLL